MALFQRESLNIFRILEFRLFVCTRFFLTLAVQMQFSTIYLQVYYEYSKEEFTLGMIGLSEAVPFIAMSLFSGHYADLHRKKSILLFSVLFLMVGALFLTLNASESVRLLRSMGISALFLVVFLFGIIRSFIAATSNPFLSQLVPRSQYTHAATWNSTSWHLACIAGPVISGLVYGHNNTFNATYCHLIELICFALAFYFLVRIRNKGLPQHLDLQESIFKSIQTGLSFVFKSKMLLSAITLDLFAVLFGGAVALIPAFTDKVLHLGPEAYGLLRTAPAIGAVIMALILVLHPPGRRAGKALLWSVAAFGLFTILFALSSNYWLAFVMLFCTGAFDNVSVVVRHSILQLMTPDNMRGRVSAINSIFIGSSNEIGAFESGVAARIMGLVPSIIFGGAMTIAVVLGINKMNPGLKKLDISEL